MRHYLANLTWRCQNHCPECWMQATVGLRPEQMRAPERGLDDWARAIRRDAVDLVDVAGGEPLLVEWLPELIRACPATRFGISTNGLNQSGLAALVRERLPNVVSINASYHPRTVGGDYEGTYRRAVATLRGVGYPVMGSVVDTLDNLVSSDETVAWLRSVGVPVCITPEETGFEDLDQPGLVGLRCQAGEAHLVVAPDGEAWPCLTALRSPSWRQLALGNWLDGTADSGRRIQPCHLWCADFYILGPTHPAGDMWGVEAVPA